MQPSLSFVGRAAGLLVIWLATAACRESVRSEATAKPTPTTATVPHAAPEVEREPPMAITDPAVLAVIEREVGDLARLAFAAEAAPHNRALADRAAYRAVRDVLAADVAAIAARDPQAGVGIRGNAHRLFDVGFLASESARFELVAVLNRMDRHFFHPQACGEVRFVYRLSYRQSEGEVVLSSRLPLTLGLELGAGEGDETDGCRKAAERWLLPRGLEAVPLARALTTGEGPLTRERISSERVLRLVTNMQTVRFPSAVRPDLGGHAEYVLRSFTPSSTGYVPAKLENTPDLARLGRDRALYAELRSYLREPGRLRALDAGLLDLPARFLAEAIVSVTPRGLSRSANRPFRSLFSARDFEDLELSTLRFARSPEALLRRLDDLTCNGCHQSRSIAGFHQLGDDARDDTSANALYTGSSPHALADVPRRTAYVRALARGEATSLARPLAERAGALDSGYGAHCGLGDRGFAEWTCADGLTCDAYEAAAGEATVGVCLPRKLETGDPCEPARVARDARGRERAMASEARACPYVCERTRVGFPGGMCASPCDPIAAEAACGGIAVLTPFNECLARKRPFSECARDHVRPAGLRRCSDRAPCRDDYVCARVRGGGVCLPPYFVFQMRVDGHPLATR